MQILARVSSKGTSYTAAQVAAQLFAPASARQWVFDWLYPDGRYQGDLTKYVDNSTIPRIVHDSTAVVKRTCFFDIRSTTSAFMISPLKDLCRVHFQLLMPDGGWIDFVIGTFILSAPTKRITKQRTHQVFTAADPGQLLVDGALLTTHTCKAGTTLTQGVNEVLSSLGSPYPFPFTIPDTGKVLSSDLVHDPGKSRMQVLWDLMQAFNYKPPFFDEWGILRSAPIPDYSTIQGTYTFDLINTSAGRTPLVEQKDVSKAFNQCIVMVQKSAPSPSSTVVLYQNINPLSEVSIPSWHAKLGPVIQDAKIVDVATALARAQAEIRQAAQIYDTIPVLTYAWPASQDLDVYGLIYNAADEGVQSNNFLEIGWTMECRHDGFTTHQLQKIIAV